ncbi:hypothetical protein PoB_000572500 [Plakobranchus ocellatus]|uniref:Uncharacterized protein n=1 Tax=Plakobranchus ocellatus TaxID=259542 RepID=A0AAV3Y7W8_9GAST|nr:hypothetical protein PoB_000572500 [Plakobranchus ocellatus]
MVLMRMMVMRLLFCGGDNHNDGGGDGDDDGDGGGAGGSVGDEYDVGGLGDENEYDDDVDDSDDDNLSSHFFSHEVYRA